MDEPQTMEAIVARIERAMQRVIQAIAPLSPGQMLEPRLPDGRVKHTLGPNAQACTGRLGCR